MTPDQRFSACLAETELFEGGYSNDKFDPGGSTYKGVTQRTYSAWPKRQHTFVQDASDEEIATIYRMQYWNAVRGDELFAGIDMVLFDIAVNSGPIVAIKFLQQELGITIDGVFGIETMGALLKVNNRRGLIMRICALRLSFWHQLTTWWRYGKGWFARGEGTEDKSLAMLEGNYA